MNESTSTARQVYEMTAADLEALLDAMKPVPYIIMGGMAPVSQQENANRAWAALGAKMGFQPMTVEPMPSKGNRYFTALPVASAPAPATPAVESTSTAPEAVAATDDEKISHLQRELLAVCRGQTFHTTWLRVSGIVGEVDYRGSLARQSRVLELRKLIFAIRPTAALYFGWCDGDGSTYFDEKGLIRALEQTKEIV